MTPQPFAQRIGAAMAAMAPAVRFFTASTYAQRAGDPTICNFTTGEPQEMALPDFAAALQRWSVPQDAHWFGYKLSERPAQATVAATLRARDGLPFEPDDIFLTNGAFAALAVCLGAVVDPGDEVIFVSPPWFFYEAMIVNSGARPVRVAINRATFDLDVDAIAAAITERTRAIIVNSPNNPMGKIYPADTLRRLAEVLTAASERNGRPIFLLSDEAYSRIVYDGRAFPSPTGFYSHSFLLYTYGKTLLTPGQRLGFVALPPTMPQREPMRMALLAAQLVTGYAFPNALLQHALPDLDRLSVDVAKLQRRRDRMVSALREMGYELHSPEATFYLLPRSPLPDDEAFCEVLAQHDIFCLPGAVVEMPGTFRISLTASDEMVERALPGFAAALAAVGL